MMNLDVFQTMLKQREDLICSLRNENNYLKERLKEANEIIYKLSQLLNGKK